MNVETNKSGTQELKEWIELIAICATLGLSVYVIWRTFAGIDAERTVSMWTYDKIRSMARNRESHWHNIAEKADTGYWNMTIRGK